mgnify:CR=1 FL=1
MRDAASPGLEIQRMGGGTEDKRSVHKGASTCLARVFREDEEVTAFTGLAHRIREEHLLREKNMPKHALLGLLLTLSATGCVVQSFHPFYTEKTRIKTPLSIRGKWKPVAGISEDRKAEKDIRPWTFSKDTALLYDAENTPSECEAIFFKVGERVYCDFTIDRITPAKKCNINAFTTSSLIPVHVLCRATCGTDTLRLFPMALEGMKSIKEANVPSIVKEYNAVDVVLFTASPKQWTSFLQTHGDHKELFSKFPEFVFKRQTAEKAEATSARRLDQIPARASDVQGYQVAIKNLNCGVQPKSGKTRTLALEMMLVLGLKPEERERGLKISKGDWAAFHKALKEMEPSIRKALRTLVAQRTYEELLAPAGQAGLKKDVKDYVNGKLKGMDLDLENENLEKDRVVRILWLTYYMQ